MRIDGELPWFHQVMAQLRSQRMELEAMRASYDSELNSMERNVLALETDRDRALSQLEKKMKGNPKGNPDDYKKEISQVGFFSCGCLIRKKTLDGFLRDLKTLDGDGIHQGSECGGGDDDGWYD